MADEIFGPAHQHSWPIATLFKFGAAHNSRAVSVSAQNDNGIGFGCSVVLDKCAASQSQDRCVKNPEQETGQEKNKEK